MNIDFQNCGQIKSAQLKIIPNKLNIKYGFNGMGKTTLGRCLSATILNDQDILRHYIPYGSEEKPKINCKGINSILYFDNDYVENYLFQESIISRSFEIVVKTPDYVEKMKGIKELLKDLNTEIQDKTLTSATSDICSVVDSIKFNKKGDFTGTSTFAKGIKKLKPEVYLQDDVAIYKNLIASPDNFSWIDWYKKGKQYIANNKCPFCLSVLPDNFDEKFNQVNALFNKSELKSNKGSNSKLATLRKFVNKEEANQIVSDQNIGAISNETKELIRRNVEVLNIEKCKLEGIQNLDPLKLISLSKEEIVAVFDEFKLNERLFKNISNELLLKVRAINIKLEKVICEIDALNAELGGLKGVLSKRIKKVSNFVNDFMNIAGIPYVIEVSCAGQEDAKTILKAKNSNFEIDDPKANLSYGELNSISLILFCVEALSKKYDLIVLDDPVSSFDGNKKYAIIYQLFSSKIEKNLRGRTVLLFTHDITPVIDFIYNGMPTQNEAEAYYLYNESGDMNESKIEKHDIISRIDNELKAAKDVNNNILHRVVSLRNYYDMTKRNDSLEYSLLSSLLHLGNKPTHKDEVEFSEDEYMRAITDIFEYITDFDYLEIIKLFSDIEILKKWFSLGSSIDKICLTRLLLTANPELKTDKVLWKFLNENFHPQNIMFYGLYNLKFKLIPEHILLSCDELFSKV